MPGMLRVIFLSSRVRQIGLTEDILHLINLYNKTDLLFQPFQLLIFLHMSISLS